MRFRLAVMLLLAAAGAPPAAADQKSDAAALLASISAALDGADQAAGACPQPEARLRVHRAIFDAREMLQIARKSAGAVLALQEKMETLQRELGICVHYKEMAEQYHAKCQGELRLGMTREEVRQTAWCEPTKIMRTDTTDHSREEWIYSVTKPTVWLGRPEGFLYFTDGKLTSIERAVGQ